MNHPSRDYQLPDDSFLYNLDVNDWSMLAHPEETNQPDDDRADKADDSSDGNLSDGHGHSLEISAIDSEFEQMMLEVEHGRRKLEELEQMLPETRQLLQEYGESEEQGPRQTLRPDAKRESPKRTTSLTLEELEEARNSRPGNYGQSKEIDQGIDWGYGMGRR